MAELWKLERGATVLPGGSVRFSVWAPNARGVSVRIVGGGRAGDHPMQASPGEPGVFSVVVRDVGPGADYGFVLDDRDQVLPDPVSRWQPEGVHGPSRVVDPRAYRWSDEGWKGIAMRQLSIYELHVGTFTPEGTFAAAIPFLRGLRRDLGVTAIEIMPVAQFPGARNWGYDGVDLYAVQNSYGGPAGLAALVDAAHAEGLAVILDVVYNHIGPEGNYLGTLGPYFTGKYQTPWGPALNYDDAQSDEVRRYVIDNALYWITEYHIDGLRLDAVHGIFDFGAKHLLQELAEAVHTQGERLGRRTLVIAESDLNDPKLIRPVSEHGYGLDGQWSDDFHHAVHAALTGETSGYYADFGTTEMIGAALAEPFVYDGRYSPHRKRRHGAPSVGIPRERFVVAIQNHDQVGNRASGDRLSTVLAPDQFRLATALLLLSPYVPLIFMGQEYGESNPFQYFVRHTDAELAEAVRAGRRKEFDAFGWGEEVPDPLAEETFARSKLNRGRGGAAEAEHVEVFALYRDLLAVREEEPMLLPDGARVDVVYDTAEMRPEGRSSGGWIVLLRTQPEEGGAGGSGRVPGEHALLAVFNCSPYQRQVPVSERARGRWALRLDTDAPGYGGQGRIATEIPEDGAALATAGVGTDHGESRDGSGGAPKRLMEAGVRGESRAPRSVSMPPWSAALFVRGEGRG